MRSPRSQQVMHLLGDSGVKSPQQISRQPPPIWMVSRLNTAGFAKNSSTLIGTHFGGRTPIFLYAAATRARSFLDSGFLLSGQGSTLTATTIATLTIANALRP